MDGIGLLQEVRQKFGDIPFILFTGRGGGGVLSRLSIMELIFTCRKEENPNHNLPSWYIKSARLHEEKMLNEH